MICNWNIDEHAARIECLSNDNSIYSITITSAEKFIYDNKEMKINGILDIYIEDKQELELSKVYRSAKDESIIKNINKSLEEHYNTDLEKLLDSIPKFIGDINSSLQKLENIKQYIKIDYFSKPRKLTLTEKAIYRTLLTGSAILFVYSSISSIINGLASIVVYKNASRLSAIESIREKVSAITGIKNNSSVCLDFLHNDVYSSIFFWVGELKDFLVKGVDLFRYIGSVIVDLFGINPYSCDGVLYSLLIGTAASFLIAINSFDSAVSFRVKLERDDILYEPVVSGLSEKIKQIIIDAAKKNSVPIIDVVMVAIINYRVKRLTILW